MSYYGKCDVCNNEGYELYSSDYCVECKKSEIKKLKAQLKEAEKVIDDLWENEPDKTEMLNILQEYLEKYPRG